MANLSNIGVPLTNAQRKFSKEIISPHKIAVVVLIKEYCSIKSKDDLPDVLPDESQNLNVVHKRDFCMLLLKLIQSPDLELDDLRKMLRSDKYTLLPYHVQKFEKHLSDIYSQGVHSMVCLVREAERLLLEPTSLNPHVHRSSVIGLFLRRIMLFFDKLNFDRVTSVFRTFRMYYNKSREPPAFGFPGKGMFAIATLEPDLSDTPMAIQEVIIEDEDEDKFASDCFGYVGRKFNLLDLSSFDNARRWTRRQAELFVSRQAALLQTDELSALPPPELQAKIRELLQTNMEYSEAHYLSFLNCMRVKECCGALDSLYHCFDRSTAEDKAFRYAALNLAVFHANFEHRKKALRALKEAIMMAHEGNDNVCLQQALAWLYKLTARNKDTLMERSITKCGDFNLGHLTSFGVVSLAQYAGLTRAHPSIVFELMARSDSLNYQHSMMDLMTYSYAQKAALWCMYGKFRMASMSCQLLLHLNTASPALGIQSYNGEGMCQAMCLMANILVEDGEYQSAEAVLKLAKKRFPNEPAASWWMFMSSLCKFTKCIFNGNWNDAERAIVLMSVINKPESDIRAAELELARGNYKDAIERSTSILDSCEDYYANSHSAYMYVRAALIASESQFCANYMSDMQYNPIFTLASALTIALNAHLELVAAIVLLHIANIQLRMGMPLQAMKLVESCMLNILANGTVMDRGQIYLIFAKCKVASSKIYPHQKGEFIREAIDALLHAKLHFAKVGANYRVKDVVYLQALLYSELGCIAERRRCAYEFRRLEQSQPTKIYGRLLSQI